ncbi:hypothetical protein F4776DRAFT_675499 [Hypoxylon sp. NC0597]|nr:hypothetical protein F4776DRAFT_675499 [Hypoxylon sp. NC0597]
MSENTIVNAFGVQIQFQQTDFASYSPVPASSTITLLPSSTSALRKPTHRNSSGGKGGLNAGAAAGIGIGTAVGVLLLVGVLVFTYCIGRRGSKNNGPTRQREGDDIRLSELRKHSVIQATVDQLSELPLREPGELDGMMRTPL